MKYPPRLSGVTGDAYIRTERPMSIQSFTTPAMFMVNADVFPISRNTAMFKAAEHTDISLACNGDLLIITTDCSGDMAGNIACVVFQQQLGKQAATANEPSLQRKCVHNLQLRNTKDNSSPLCKSMQPCWCLCIQSWRMHSVPNAAAAFVRSTNGLNVTAGSFMILGASSMMNGSSKKPKQHGAM